MKRLAVVLLAILCAGCGPGAGSDADAPTGVNVVVTRDFGARELRDVDSSKVPAGETVMRYLERKFEVETRYGGGFVQSLEGLSGGKDADGRPVDWFYYVNGIEARQRRRVAQDRRRATASGGTATTGAPPSASRPWSARGQSRS